MVKKKNKVIINYIKSNKNDSRLLRNKNFIIKKTNTLLFLPVNAKA